jgi:DNA repair exonuclease SbcCD ATPase subunit
MKIAHLSDIHIRFSSRHAEYKEVFDRLFDDLKKQKPNRIVITGDLNHLKVNMSPGSVNLTSEFLINLAKIAPVDIIFGNHDLNLQQKEQGDTITPIFNIADRFADLVSESVKKTFKKSFIINKNNVDFIDFSKKGIYLFPDSDFYKISDDLIYGVYSCKDNKILTLDKKNEGVKYVALYHGQLKGARGDNGYELINDGLLNITTFNNFDVVMMGDIHEHQAFRDNESMAYCGSLIQQDYGESIDKGYLMWDLDKKTFQRRYILNDYGFAKLTIAKGEMIEERIENIKFSNNKRKTKVYITWEDYEENYSTEKEMQIAKLVKEKFGCDVVKVEFSEMKKAEQDNTDVADSINKETFLQQIITYFKETNPDEDKDIINEVLELAKYVDKELEISEKVQNIKLWDVDCIEISNIFSFPEKPIIINLEKMRGSTGIFGKNYSGKSNVVKAIVWGLYQHILGGGSAKKLVNIYTSSNKGYVKIHLTIDGEKYYIKREVITTIDKHNESSNKYPVEFKKLITDDSGKQKWASEISDKKANVNIEVKSIILDSIGVVEDFTKVCLQTQGGKEDYINQEQQPKNDLVNKYLGLEPFRVRYDFCNKKFNDIKKKQKELGDIIYLQAKVLEIENKITTLKSEYDSFVKEKDSSEKKKEKIDNEIISLTKELKQYSPIIKGELSKEEDVVILINETKRILEQSKKDYQDLLLWTSTNFKKELPFDEQDVIEKLGTELSIQENIPSNINILQQQLEIDIQNCEELSNWVSNNFKKELPFDEKESIEKLSQEYTKENEEFNIDKAKYIKIEKWINTNPVRQLYSIEGFGLIVQNLNFQIADLNAKLPTYKGEKCPTCGHITTEPNIELYNQCLEDISAKTGLVNNYTNAINKFYEDSQHNNNCEIQNSNLLNLRLALTSRKSRKEALIQKIELISQSQGIIAHNKDVENKNQTLQWIKKEIDNKTKNIERLNLLLQSQEIINHNKIVDVKTHSMKSIKLSIDDNTELLKKLDANLVKIKEISNCLKYNLSIENNILQLQEQNKAYKISIYGFSQQITNKNGDIRVEENNLENFINKLDEVKNAEKTYKKYSLYLQAVHRDGIPAKIIRRKLPIINNKINSILSTIVNFKIEMSVTTKGDVIEGFYFSRDKSDMLPLAFASGAQKFISSVVIKDSLHYMSNLIKPSLNIIDEGFGTLDDDLISGIITVLQYLKNKYKNVLVITHRNEIKDSVNNIIEVYKTFENIPQEVLDMNEHAGITKINIS